MLDWREKISANFDIQLKSDKHLRLENIDVIVKRSENAESVIYST